jgi:hypothetical protein
MTDKPGPKDLEAVLARLQDKWQQLADLLSNQPQPDAAAGTAPAEPDAGKPESPPGAEAESGRDDSLEIIDRLEKLEAQQRREKIYRRFILAVLGVILIAQAFLLVRPYLGGSMAGTSTGPQITLTPEREAKAEGEAEVGFVGSKTSNRYHFPTCRLAKTIRPERLITFKSATEAQERHYKPCPVCKPPPLSP